MLIPIINGGLKIAMLSEKEKKVLIQKLKNKWENLSWPGTLSDLDTKLFELACRLMEINTFFAGCVSQIIKTGNLPMNFRVYLVVDHSLTQELSVVNENRSQEFLTYKQGLDECIVLVRKILEMEI